MAGVRPPTGAPPGLGPRAARASRHAIDDSAADNSTDSSAWRTSTVGSPPDADVAVQECLLRAGAPVAMSFASAHGVVIDTSAGRVVARHEPAPTVADDDAGRRRRRRGRPCTRCSMITDVGRGIDVDRSDGVVRGAEPFGREVAHGPPTIAAASYPPTMPTHRSRRRTPPHDRRRPLWNESYYLDWFTDDGRLGGYVRIGFVPALGGVWYWACLVEEGGRLVTVIDDTGADAVDSRVDGAAHGRTVGRPCGHGAAGADVMQPRGVRGRTRRSGGGVPRRPGRPSSVRLRAGVGDRSRRLPVAARSRPATRSRARCTARCSWVIDASRWTDGASATTRGARPATGGPWRGTGRRAGSTTAPVGTPPPRSPGSANMGVSYVLPPGSTEFEQHADDPRRRHRRPGGTRRTRHAFASATSSSRSNRWRGHRCC